MFWTIRCNKTNEKSCLTLYTFVKDCYPITSLLYLHKMNCFIIELRQPDWQWFVECKYLHIKYESKPNFTSMLLSKCHIKSASKFHTNITAEILHQRYWPNITPMLLAKFHTNIPAQCTHQYYCRNITPMLLPKYHTNVTGQISNQYYCRNFTPILVWNLASNIDVIFGQ
jgi:hypothetical protein